MNIVQIAETFAKKEYTKNDPGHQWNHIERVMSRALEIAKEIKNVDYELLRLGVIFHDIDYHTGSTQEEKYRNHVDNSAKVAESFLRKNGYPEEKIAKIKQIILDHSTPHRMKLGDSEIPEGKILYDADKTSSMQDTNRKKLSPERRERIYNLLYFEQTRKYFSQKTSKSFRNHR